MYTKMAASKEDNFESLINAMTVMDFEIGSQFYAKPTHVVDPHDFYLIPFPYIHHLASLSKPGEPYSLEDLKENSVVIFTSSNPHLNQFFKIELDQNVRGVIQRINNDKTCQILALDRGFLERDVSIDRIYHPMHDEARDMPSLIQNCELHLCSPKEPNFSTEAVNAFKFYLGNEKLSVVIRGKTADKLKVVVYNSNPDDIATLLALTHYTYLSIYVSDRNAVAVGRSRQKLTYQHVNLDVGQVLKVRVQSGTSLGSFFVTPMSSYQGYLKNRADFTNYCKSVPEIAVDDFRPGTIVGVPQRTEYYERAVVLETITDSKAKVQLLDWGTEIVVPKHNVKAIKTELFTMSPACAIFCAAADGFVPWDNGLSQFLYKGYTFIIKIKNVGNGFVKPNIVSIARDC